MQIPIYFYESLDSTSDEAARLLADKCSVPFAVACKTQTRGRGQRGRTWQSPSGNLFLTLALPPRSDLGSPALLAATLVAQWLSAEYQLRITLKWPNDLCFGGRKLGGILCESSYNGQSWGPLLVGIGLNVAAAPTLSDQPYRSIALAELISKPDPQVMARSLCDFWGQHWGELPWGEALRDYQGYQTGVGQLWQGLGDPKRFFRENGLNADGNLLLTPLDEPKRVMSLASAAHDFQWSYQDRGEATAPLILADIGNTATKIAFYRNPYVGEPDALWSFQPADAGPLFDRLHTLLSEQLGQKANHWPIYLGSVNANGENALREACAHYGFSGEVLSKRPLRSWGGHLAFSELGIDRLAKVEAWLAGVTPEERAAGKTFALIVGFGTATTCEVVRSSGEYFGGFIAPGLQMSLDALAEKTALLPQLAWEGLASEVRAALASPDSWGATTETAMTQGVLAMAVGFVKQTINQMVEGFHINPEDVELVLSGGLLPALASYFKGSRLEPHLTLEGLRLMV